MMTKPSLLKAFLDDTEGMAGREQGLRLAQSIAEISDLNPVAESLRAADNGLLILVVNQHGRKERVLACASKDKPPGWMERFTGDRTAYRFRDHLQKLLIEHSGLHDQMIAEHLGKHLRLLRGGEE